MEVINGLTDTRIPLPLQCVLPFYHGWDTIGVLFTDYPVVTLYHLEVLDLVKVRKSSYNMI